MPTYDVKETTKGNDSNSSLTDQAEIIYSARRSWTVATSETGPDSSSAQAALQQLQLIPLEGDAHPDNAALICRTVKVVRESPIFYTVEANYQSNTITAGGSLGDQPWNQPATTTYRSVSSDEETDFDFNGRLIANPGTFELVTGVTKRISDIVAIIKRDFLVFSGPTIRTYMDKTNTDSYLGFPPGEGLVWSIEAEPQTYQQTTYYTVTAEILFRTPLQTTSDKAWYNRRAVKGFYELVQDFPIDRRVRSLDDDNEPVTEPVLIDQSGYRIGGLLPTPYYEETQVQGSINYSSMGFF